MLTEEYGLAATQRAPLRSALATFGAFILCGAVPLLPFLVPLPDPLVLASALTAAVFFLIGAAKSRWALAPWWYSGSETLAIGLLAAGAAYAVGYFLKGIG